MGLYALTDANIKVPINKAVKGEHYRCPDCLKDVFPVAKSTRAKEHFTHRAGEACIEYKYTKPTPWAEQLINRFPEEYRHIPLTIDGQIYTADIYKDDLILLFQSGDNASEELESKVDAYLNEAYTVALIVNVEADYYNGVLSPKDEESKNMLKWTAAPLYLKRRLPQNTKDNFAIYLYISDAEHSENGRENIRRVLWTPDTGSNTWKYIIIDEFKTLRISEKLQAGDIFDSPFKQAWNYVEMKKVRKFYELYAGEKGKGSADVYKCPKTKDWIQPIRECKKCGFCMCMVFYTKEGHKCNKIYCSYERGCLEPIPNVRTFGHY